LQFFNGFRVTFSFDCVADFVIRSNYASVHGVVRPAGDRVADVRKFAIGWDCKLIGFMGVCGQGASE
jgi:hypothetical protein